MFAFAAITLQFQANLPHPLRTFARLDFVDLFGLSRGFCTHFGVQLLLATLAFPLQTLVDVDSSALVVISRVNVTASLSLFALVLAIAVEFAERIASITRQRSSVRQLRAACQDICLALVRCEAKGGRRDASRVRRGSHFVHRKCR